MPIKIENLFYSYLKKTPNVSTALNGVSLNINDGKFVAIIGHTGSGKSTLIQHLNALLVADSGSLQVDEYVIYAGKKKNKNIKALRKHVGVVFQFPEYQLFEETVEKDVSFGPRNFGVNKEEALKKAHEALLSVGLDESFFTRSPFDLSGGEKRRVAIAGILAIEPDVLVLDEPTAGLDPIGQEEIMSLAKKLHDEGKTMIFVTHDMDLVMKYADRAIVMDDGRIVFDDTPAVLFSENRENFSIEIPLIYRYIGELNKKGYKIDIKNIKSVDDLVLAIKKRKK